MRATSPIEQITEQLTGRGEVPTGGHTWGGRFHTLREALQFYADRDTNPGKWYPKRPNGKVEKFNDLPAQYRNNVDTSDPPLNREPGEKPVWNGQQINDVIEFLKTLTDRDVVEKEVSRSAPKTSGEAGFTYIR